MTTLKQLKAQAARMGVKVHEEPSGFEIEAARGHTFSGQKYAVEQYGRDLGQTKAQALRALASFMKSQEPRLRGRWTPERQKRAQALKAGRKSSGNWDESLHPRDQEGKFENK